MSVRTSPPSLQTQLELDLARGTSDLPTLPRGVTEALRLARTPGLDFDELAHFAADDPPLAARIISAVNSVSYARAGMTKIASVRQAAVRLGTQATRDVLYQVAYTSIFIDTPCFREHVEATFQHGARAARCARLLARNLRLDPDIAFLAALLHDIGRARCWKLLAKRRDAAAALAVAARAVDDLHTVAGEDLAIAWRLPDAVVEGCRWHHAPAGRTYALLVAVADVVARLDGENGAEETARGYLLSAGVPADRIDDLIARAAQQAGGLETA